MPPAPSTSGYPQAVILRSRQPPFGSSDICRRKSYSDAVRVMPTAKDEKSYKLFVKSKNNQSAEYIRTLVKTKLDPVDIKVGVKSCRTLRNGQVIIESSNKEEAEIICNKINEKCGEELEAVTNKN
ncbi:hypothetical protein C0J52_19782 [Blattella germanica]|nr:hypothetical protein C0J52_19782 [Blattella germanica]